MAISSPREANRVPAMVGVSSTDGTTPVNPYVDPVTHRLYVDSAISGTNIAAHFNRDTFTSTNNQTIFTASQTVLGDVYFAINGSIQTPSVDYTVSGSTSTLTNGIPPGNVIVWAYFY